MGERRSQWRTVFVWPALSSPNMAGLQAGASVSPGDILPLSCSVDFTHEAEFVTWLVDGQIQGEDYHLVRQGDSLISQWNFLPQTGQSAVECRANGDEQFATKIKFTLSVPKEEAVKEETIEESDVADNTMEEEDAIKEDEDTVQDKDVVEEDDADKEVEEKAAEKVFWIPQQSPSSSSSHDSSWLESSRSSQSEAEEEYRRAEKVPEVSAHSLKKSDMDLSVRDSSFSSSGIPLSSSLLLPVILSLALLRDN